MGTEPYQRHSFLRTTKNPEKLRCKYRKDFGPSNRTAGTAPLKYLFFLCLFFFDLLLPSAFASCSWSIVAGSFCWGGSDCPTESSDKVHFILLSHSVGH